MSPTPFGKTFPAQTDTSRAADSLPGDTGAAAQVEGVVRDVGTSFTEWLEGLTGLGPQAQWHVLLSVLAVVLIYGLRKIVVRVVDRRVEDPKIVYQWSKTSGYLALFLSFLMVGTIWLEGIRQLGTFLGLLSAGVAIALKDVVTGMAGWMFILWRRPFRFGDRIQLGERAGDVVDIRLFQFTILEIGNWVHADQSTGRIIHLPNSLVFSEPLANYTAQFDFIWNEVAVLVTFESDWKLAKALLEEIVEAKAGGLVAEAQGAMKATSRKYLIHFRTLTPKVYTSVEDSGVLLTLRFICRARQRRGMTEEIWEAVLEAFGREEGIDFAYPTTRMYHNILEGKSEARAPVPGVLDAPPDGGRKGRLGDG
jgi:small-conductance mechanosensitive channel